MPKKDIAEKKKPIKVASLKGLLEKVVKPSRAKTIIFLKEYFVEPDSLLSLIYFIDFTYLTYLTDFIYLTYIIFSYLANISFFSINQFVINI